MDPYIGEIRLFAGNFAPEDWAFCNGQLLPLSQNTALFALLGTSYGGDGKTTFALPDFRGRIPIHVDSRENYVGCTTREGAPAEVGTSHAGIGTLGLNFIIALQGVFPPRF